MMVGWNIRGKNSKLMQVGFTAFLGAIVVTCSCWLRAADEPANPGLRGILPGNVPSDLTGALAVLPENWQPWAGAVGTELASLYEAEDSDAASQRKTIAALRKREATARAHAADPKYRSLLNALVSISGGLKRRLDVSTAALDLLENGTAQQTAKVEAARKNVVKQAQSLEGYLGSMQNGASWGKYLRLSDVQTANVTDAAAIAKDRLKAKESLENEKAREFLSRAQFAGYEEAVEGYLNVVAQPPVDPNQPALRQHLTDLFKALEDYEATRSSAASQAVRKALEAIRAAVPGQAENLALALRDNYFNYNLRVVATEAYLNKFMHQIRNEAGPVRDFILGANVFGNQTTRTVVDIDLIPSGSSVQFDLRANGQVASNTAGVTDQATVYTYGNHSFLAAKRMVFDGDKFASYPARISVNANNSTTGADTNMGILSGIGNNIAVNRAEGMRGESEAIAASRIRDRVLPEFNSEVEKQFGEINPKVEARLAALRELGLYPEAKSWSTTDTELKVSTRLMTSAELGGSEPNPAMYLGRGISILLHDTMMNNALDRLDIAGKTVTEAELKAKLEGQATKLLGREVKFEEKEVKDDSGIKSIVFDKADPIRVHADDGVLIVTLRAGFQQEGKEDIPTQVITFPLQFSVTMEAVTIEPGNFEVSAAEAPESAAKQLAQAGVIKKKLGSAFPKRDIDRVKRVQEKNINTVTAVTRIRSLDGWLSISVE